MKLGFLTACLRDIPLKEKAEIAAQTGFETLEISYGDIGVMDFNNDKAAQIKDYMSKLGLEVSMVACYDNNLHPDPEKRAHINTLTKKSIDAAAMLGAECVGTFVGRNSNLNYADNFNEFEKVFGELVAYAEDKKIKLTIENCPMNNWQGDGHPGTISYTPELWREMFSRIDSDYFGLNFDPSHLVPLFIDYIRAIDEFKSKIFHFHAKDCEIIKDNLYSYGAFNRRLNHDDNLGFWRFRMPGLGDIDWEEIFACLKSIGYNGVISIEHEDSIHEGTNDKVKNGLKIGYDFLSKLM